MPSRDGLRLSRDRSSRIEARPGLLHLNRLGGRIWRMVEETYPTTCLIGREGEQKGRTPPRCTTGCSRHSPVFRLPGGLQSPTSLTFFHSDILHQEDHGCLDRTQQRRKFGTRQPRPARLFISVPEIRRSLGPSYQTR